MSSKAPPYAPEYAYPNRFARAFFLAMDEVMGRHGRENALDTARLMRYNDHLPPDNLAREVNCAGLAAVNTALDTLYGARGGRGMALRIGRAWFSGGLASFGALAGCTDPAFRVLPADERVEMGLMALADVFTHFSDQASHIEVLADSYRFIAAPGATAVGQQSAHPICQPIVGMLQEAMRWFSNGREYAVREVECVAVGAAACVFVISRQPL